MSSRTDALGSEPLKHKTLWANTYVEFLVGPTDFNYSYNKEEAKKRKLFRKL